MPAPRIHWNFPLWTWEQRFVINGRSDDFSGYSVSSAGESSGDGFDDLIIGGLGADPPMASREKLVVFVGRQGGFGASGVVEHPKMQVFRPAIAGSFSVVHCGGDVEFTDGEVEHGD